MFEGHFAQWQRNMLAGARAVWQADELGRANIACDLRTCKLFELGLRNRILWLGQRRLRCLEVNGDLQPMVASRRFPGSFWEGVASGRVGILATQQGEQAEPHDCRARGVARVAASMAAPD